MADVKKEIALEVSMADNTSAGTTSAKKRLRELQQQLIDMAIAGQEGTQAFKDLEAQAGELKDTIGDVSTRVKNMASDTRTIDTFVAGIQGIAAGFQIAQGAAALFGDENEDLQKAMLKVQGAMALANGVQQVANLLQKESILMTQGAAAAQKLYALAVGTSTGALRAFRIALAATGIGAVVVALGLAAEAMGLFTSKTKDNTKAQEENKRALDETAGTLEYYERRLKANGATEADLARDRLKTLKAEKAELDRKLAEDIARYGNRLDEYRRNLRHEIELLDIKIKEENQIIAADNKAKAEAQAQKNKADADERKRASEKKIKDKEEENQKIAILAANELKAEKEIAEYEKAEVEEEKKRAEEKERIRKELLEKLKQYEQEAFNAANELSQAKIARIENEGERERLLAEDKKRILAKEYEDRKLQAQTEITDTATLNQALLLLNQQFLNQQAAQDEVYAEKKKQLKQQEKDTTIKFAGEAFTGILSLGEAMMGTSEADARKAFNLNKAASIADATVNTFLAATQALRDPKLPTIAKAFAVGGIIASGLAQVRKIAATQFKASGAPSGGSGGGGTGTGTTSAPQPSEIFANPQTTMLGTDGAAMNGGRSVPPTRAYVVERDIEQTSRRVRRLEEFATLS
jgi:hypothetical protein